MISRKTAYAATSLREHALYLEENAGLEVAERYLNAVEDTLAFIYQEPGIGSPCDFTHPRLKNMRRWPVRDFENYLLFYQETEKGIVLLYVFHGRQDIDAILSEPPDDSES